MPESPVGGAEADQRVARSRRTPDGAAIDLPSPSTRTPTEAMEVETPWADLWLTTADWAEAFEAADPGTPHNLARDDVCDELLTILADKLDVDAEVSA